MFIFKNCSILQPDNATTKQTISKSTKTKLRLNQSIIGIKVKAAQTPKKTG